MIFVEPAFEEGDGGEEVVLTFLAGSGTNTYDNSMYAGNVFSVLKNGLYRLNTVGSKVHAGGETMAGGTRQDVFWSLYGAYDTSDSLVSATPTAGTSIISVNASIVLFGQTYGSNPVDVGPWPFYIPGFDANLDGEVSGEIMLNVGS